MITIREFAYFHVIGLEFLQMNLHIPTDIYFRYSSDTIY